MRADPLHFSPLGLTRAFWLPLLILAALVLLPGRSWAHAGDLHLEGHRWWQLWSWEPHILLSLGALGLLYSLGLRSIWKRAGVGKGISARQAIAFWAGWLALFVALVSPIDILSAQLSSVHMIQHMILMNVAAPLLVLGSPLLVCLCALPLPPRQRVGRWMQALDRWQSPRYLLWQPLLLWAIYGLVLWIWHLPALYTAALTNEWVHDFQHVSFVVASCLFWRVLLDPISRLRLSRGLGIIYLFATSLHATVLGVFMALSPRVWYDYYEPLTPAWNLSPLEDQQLAGLIMWMPACMVYAIIAAVLFALWLDEDPERARERLRLSMEGA
jgi:putative membrane protein